MFCSSCGVSATRFHLGVFEGLLAAFGFAAGAAACADLVRESSVSAAKFTLLTAYRDVSGCALNGSGTPMICEVLIAELFGSRPLVTQNSSPRSAVPATMK